MHTLFAAATVIALASTSVPVENELDRTAPAPAVTERAAEPRTGPILEHIEVQQVERSDYAAAATAQPPRNWWWTIGAIVVAGIILAIIL